MGEEGMEGEDDSIESHLAAMDDAELAELHQAIAAEMANRAGAGEEAGAT